ncbi:MAG: hypothetical protein ACK40G_13925 [Cytophagaceae bacterium]
MKLGNLILLADGIFDVLTNVDVSNNDSAMVNDAYNVNSLTSAGHITGFAGAGAAEQELQGVPPSNDEVAFEIDGAAGHIFGRFKDAGIADKEYEVNIYFICENHMLIETEIEIIPNEEQ